MTVSKTACCYLLLGKYMLEREKVGFPYICQVLFIFAIIQSFSSYMIGIREKWYHDDELPGQVHLERLLKMRVCDPL